MEKWKPENVAGQGYDYQEQQLSGKEMIEFHMDDYDFLHSVAEEMDYGMFGGNFSVCKPHGLKPLMILLKPRQTPKFHAKMASEGIEYSWACQRASTAKCHWILERERLLSRRE